MKRVAAGIAIAIGSMSVVWAAPGDDAAEKFFSKQSPRLSTQEQAGLAVGHRWSASAATGMRPFAGRDGAVQFVFGVQQASVVCAVLQVCDIALQAGEQVNSINVGDNARWTIEPAVTGAGDNEVQHLIVKPLDVGLETSVVVATSRRTYHIRLRSHRTQYMPQVAFSYPEDTSAQWQALQRQRAQERQQKTIPETGEFLGDLSFAYDVAGGSDVRWKPVRVYNDGTRTVIEMPKALQQTEAPTLLVVRRDGGKFADDAPTLVNYRLQGNRYIVDNVFDRAILIAGVGNSQQRVTITRRPE